MPVWLVPGARSRDAAIAAGPDRVLADFAELLEFCRE